MQVRILFNRNQAFSAEMIFCGDDSLQPYLLETKKINKSKVQVYQYFCGFYHACRSGRYVTHRIGIVVPTSALSFGKPDSVTRPKHNRSSKPSYARVIPQHLTMYYKRVLTPGFYSRTHGSCKHSLWWPPRPVL
jgi:hypothetical protein